MQTVPANWAALFNSAHKTEYKFIINDIEYLGTNLQGDPKITKALLDKPAIGRVCSATVSVVVRPKDNIEIPKAARVSCFCRLVSPDGQTVTSWIPQGNYFISSRSGKTNLTLNLRDDMVKAGQTYFDKSQITDWPAGQDAVVEDIARIMGVEIDSRTQLRVGSSYRVNYLDTNTLISEILSAIAASNGGSWVMTENGKLRLVPLASPASAASQVLAKRHSGYTDEGIDAFISRITMTDNGDTTYTAGDDTGIELTINNPFADQTVVDNLINQLYGVVYRPHRIEKAMLNPLLELGDTISVQKGDGNTALVPIYSAVISCNTGYVATVEGKAAQDSEEEFPYKTPQELQAAHSVRTDRTYYGTSLNKGSGLVIRRIKGDQEEARVTFNADEMAFYQGSKQVLFFDAENQTWKMSAEMEVMVENADGSTSELNVLARGWTSQIRDVNGRTLKMEATVNGLTITTEQGETLIDGGSIYTDDLHLSQLFSKTGVDSYIEMLDNGLNFVLGRAETIGIGYHSADRPLPYMILGAGTSSSANVGMVKRYANGLWIGDSVDRYSDTIQNGTGFFVNTTTQKLYKYVRGYGAELADTSNVVAVFG